MRDMFIDTIIQQRDRWAVIAMVSGFITIVLATMFFTLLSKDACAQTLIQPPVGVPSSVYTSPSGVTTVTPPAGAPTTIYPATVTNPVTTIQPPVGLPTFIYGR